MDKHGSTFSSRSGDPEPIVSPNQGAVLDCLSSLGIAFDRHEHPVASTVAEAEVYWKEIDATHCKNLFLRNQKGDRHYLVVVGHAKAVDLRRLAELIGDGKLSFASPERLMLRLGLTPGSVSPFGLLNDPERHVRVFLDAALEQAERITFHPNDNTATLALAYADFRTFLRHAGHQVRIIPI